MVIAIGGFYLYQYLTAREIYFSLKAPANISVGVPFNIEIEIQNNSENPLKDGRISMILPEGTAILAESPDKRVLNRSFGDLDASASFQEKFRLLFLITSNPLKNLKLPLLIFRRVSDRKRVLKYLKTLR